MTSPKHRATPKIGARMVRDWQGRDLYTVDHLLDRWRRLTLAERETARQWYPLMNAWCRGVAMQYRRPVDQVYALNAVLSQSTRLDLNLELVHEYLRNRPGHRRSLFAHDKALAILAGGVIADFVKGEKITRYHRSIVSAGEDPCACIDRWNGRAPFEGDTWVDYITADHAVADTAYPIIEGMHLDAAEIVGERPADFQAGIWKETRKHFAYVLA